MASTPLFYDRVLETSTTTGTGTLTLAGAVAGYQAWSAVGNSNSAQYYIEAVDANGIPTGDWEVGVGTYTSSGTTLSRTVILASSNSGSAVSLSAGTKRVGLVAPVAAAAVPVNSDWGGRLTLLTAVPIPNSDQAAKTHLFYTPYLHNRTPKWNGSSWERVIFTQYDLTLSATSGKAYDVFWNGSALSLSSAWTDGNTRADALSTQDGVPCLGSDKTKLLVGSFYASATNTTDDSFQNRLVSNLYNTVSRPCMVASNSSHSYTTASERNYNNSATETLIQWMSCAIGIPAVLDWRCNLTSAGATNALVLLQLDGGSDETVYIQGYNPVSGGGSFAATVTKYLTLGYHSSILRENSNGNACTYNYAYSAFTNFMA